jgi:hypothetical protein
MCNASGFSFNYYYMLQLLGHVQLLVLATHFSYCWLELVDFLSLLLLATQFYYCSLLLATYSGFSSTTANGNSVQPLFNRCYWVLLMGSAQLLLLATISGFSAGTANGYSVYLLPRATQFSYYSAIACY